MPDMLVKLYELPPLEGLIAAQREQGVAVRRAIGPERHHVLDWVAEHFDAGWASECAVAFAQTPISCFVAVQDHTLLGFACHDATTCNFFGPTGVRADQRGRGIGKALLLACLHQMRAIGYAYAVIGDPGPEEFYAATVGAFAIPGSSPGVYAGMLRRNDE